MVCERLSEHAANTHESPPPVHNDCKEKTPSNENPPLLLGTSIKPVSSDADRDRTCIKPPHLLGDAIRPISLDCEFKQWQTQRPQTPVQQRPLLQDVDMESSEGSARRRCRSASLLGD